LNFDTVAEKILDGKIMNIKKSQLSHFTWLPSVPTVFGIELLPLVLSTTHKIQSRSEPWILRLEERT
jgi:hypothetical protein